MHRAVKSRVSIGITKYPSPRHSTKFKRRDDKHDFFPHEPIQKYFPFTISSVARSYTRDCFVNVIDLSYRK